MSIEILSSAQPCLDFEPPLPDSLPSVWLKDLHGKDAPRWIWVVPSARRRRALIRNWPTTSQGRSSLLPRIVTLEGLTDLVAAHIGTRGKRITSLERRLRVLRAWQISHPGLSSGLGTALQVDHLVKSFQENRVEPVEPSDKAFFDQYNRGLKEAGRLDRNGLWNQVAEDLKRFPADRWKTFPFRGVVIDGFHRFGLPELSFLEALGRRIRLRIWFPCPLDGPSGELLQRHCEALGSLMPDPSPLGVATPLSRWAESMLVHESHEGTYPDPPQDGSLLRLDLRDAAAEVRDLVKRVRLTLREKDGPKPHEIAVVVPGPQYDAMLRQAFSNAGITVNIAGQNRFLSQSGPGRLIHAALTLAHGGESRRALVDFLRIPLVSTQLFGGFAPWLTWLEETLRDFPEPEGFSGWSSLLDRIRENLMAKGPDSPPSSLDSDEGEPEPPGEREIQRHENRLQGLEKVKEALALLAPLAKTGDSMEDCLASLGALMARLHLPRRYSPGEKGLEGIPPEVWQDEQLAWEKLKAVLNRLRDIPEDALPRNRLGEFDPLQVVKLALESESYQIKTEDDEGVQILEIRETRGLHFRHVLVLGLQSGSYDAKSSEEILRRLLNEQKQAEAYQWQEARLLFFQLGLVAREKLVLYRPCFQGEEALLPSVWLEGIKPSPLASTQAILVGQKDLLIHAGWCRPLAKPWETVDFPEGDKTAEQVLQRIDQLRNAAIAWQASLVHGLIDDWALSAIPHRYQPGRPFSPSRIESYTRCPFRFFAESVLGLRDRDADETALVRGNLLHELFHRFIANQREQLGLENDQPLSLGFSREESRNQLVEILREILNERPAQAALVDSKVESIITAPGGAIDLYLDHLQRFADLDIRHIASETQVGPREITGASEGVWIQGRMDDWFAWPDGRAILVDYKSGKPPEQADFARDHKERLRLQLDLYAAALDREVAQGIYLFFHVTSHPKEKDHVKNRTRLQGEMVKGWSGLPRGVQEPTPLDPAGARLHAATVAQSVRRGVFPLTTLRDGEECQGWCGAKSICRTPHPTSRAF